MRLTPRHIPFARLADLAEGRLSPEEAAQVVKKLEGTYGKVYLLWDPGKGQPAVGQPRLSILK